MSALGWIAAELPAPDRDPRRVGRVVHEVLARHQYRRPTPSTIDRVRSEVVDRVASFLSRVVGAGVGAWFVVAVVLALVVLAAWRFGRGTSLERGRAFPATASVGRTAEDWRAEADAHERAGEWRRALRCRYRALVAELADRGIVDEVPGRTAGEYRVAVGGALPAAGDPFSGATELFERAWYGAKPTGPDDSARFRELSERVLVGAGR